MPQNMNADPVLRIIKASVQQISKMHVYSKYEPTIGPDRKERV